MSFNFYFWENEKRKKRGQKRKNGDSEQFPDALLKITPFCGLLGVVGGISALSLGIRIVSRDGMTSAGNLKVQLKI